MPGAAIIATTLQTPAARFFSLWVGGVDVIKQPGSRAYGVDERTITNVINGPGGVSTSSFDIDDPQQLLTIQKGQTVMHFDHTFGVPLFSGWVDHYTVVPDFGGQGRTWKVSAVGLEKVLDWAKLTTAYVYPAVVTQLDALVQGIVGACMGTRELRALSGGGTQGTQALPVGDCGAAANLGDGGAGVGFTIPAGTTLRQALAVAVAVCLPSRPAATDFSVTVDHLWGLRVWQVPTPNPPGGNLAVGSGGANPYPTNPTLSVEAAPTGCIVIGTGVNVFVGDGTPGDTAVIRDTAITTTAEAQARGAAYLAAQSTGVRGSLLIGSVYVLSALNILDRLTLTDPSAGASGTYPVRGLTFTFAGPTQDVTVAFGGRRPSGAALLRNLTRDQLS